jgi:hypothetical protein
MNFAKHAYFFAVVQYCGGPTGNKARIIGFLNIVLAGKVVEQSLQLAYGGVKIGVLVGVKETRVLPR